MHYTAIIDQLAEKLAVPGGQLLALLPGIAMKDIGQFFAWSIATIILCRMMWFASKRIADWEESAIAATIIAGIGAIITGFCSLCMLPQALLAITNPQAWALDYILRMIQ